MMNDLRSWLLGIAVTLVVTGIIGKLVPEKSNKSIINFVITMVIIINFLGFDSSIIEDFSGFELTTDIHHKKVLESEINSQIKQILSNEIAKEIQETVDKYTQNAVVSVEFDDQTMVIKITSKELADNDKLRLENEIREKFEGEISFIYTAVN